MKRNYSITILSLLLMVIMAVNSNSQQPDSFNVVSSVNPSAGYLFVGPYSNSAIALVDNSGIPVYVSNLGVTRGGIEDFRVWQNGLATFWNRDMFTNLMSFYAVNDRYEIVDTFSVTSSYMTDFHDFQWLSNGHYLMLGEDWRTIDMSVIVPNGNPTARVKGNVIQEFDANHNLVWQWDTFDHFQITDATPDIDLTKSVINYCHINSCFFDTDGNLIISSRHFDEVTKISKNTGNIIWRMGGTSCRNNQFSFLNDTRNGFFGFSHQHDVQRLSNGHLLMFDNGNLKGDSSSRAVEYEVDEINKTVSKVWEYRHSPEIYTDAMGSVQKLPNGNTLIGWSVNVRDITCTELNENGNIEFEMSMPQTQSYRIYRQVFKMASTTRNVSSTSSYSFNETNNNTHVEITVTNLNGTGDVQMEEHYYAAHNQSFSSTAPNEVFPARWVMTSKSISLITGTMYFDLDSINNFSSPDRLDIYYRAREGTGSFYKLTTTYNQTTRKLETVFPGFGEFIIGMPDLESPVQDSPLNDAVAVDIPVKLKWKQLFNAVSYRLQISTSPSFETLALDSSGIRDTAFIATNSFLINYTKYYWRLNAVKNGQTTTWSSIRAFTTALPPPNLTTPADSAVNMSLNGTLSWEKVLMAGDYKIQISEHPDFSSYLLNMTIPSTEYEYNNLETNKQYYWRVASVNGSYLGHWSNARIFMTMLDTLKLVFPPDDYTGLNPKSSLFTWNKLDGANLYHVQISNDSNFSRILKDVGAIKDTFYIETGLSFGEKYYWRVTGVGKFSSGHWSETRKVLTSLGPPSLIQPTNRSRNLATTGQIVWEKTFSAISYHIIISTDSLFKNIVQEKDHYSLSSLTYQNLTYDTKYFWKVSAYTTYGESNWSDIWEFQTRREFYIEPPILNTPISEQFNVSISGTLNWGATPYALSYRVQISTDNAFNNPILDDDGITQTEFDYALLEYNTQYFWRVLTNGDKSKSDWSEPSTFYTLLETSVLLNPPDKSQNVKVNTPFTWKTVGGANNYLVQFSKDYLFNQYDKKYSDVNKFVKIGWLVGFSKYYWRVKGINGQKESDWSDVWSFITDDLSSTDEINISGIGFDAYPNPFNDKLTFSFDIKEQSNLEISIENLEGKLLHHKINELLDFGHYNLILDTSEWDLGVCLVKVNLKNEVKVIKLIKTGK